MYSSTVKKDQWYKNDPRVVEPFTQNTVYPHLSRMIRRKGGCWESIKLLGSTPEGVYLGELECGPFITYAWMADNCIFDSDCEPCGVIKG